MSDITSDAGRIERDLDQTRSRLGTHLNELQDRLSPGQVLDDLMAYFRGNEGAEFGRSLLDNVRGNPLPAAITTVGLAWLMASTPRGTAGNAGKGNGRSPGALSIYGHDDHKAAMARLTSARQAVLRAADEPDPEYSARLDEAQGHAIGLARHSEETAESFGQRIRHAVGAIEGAVTCHAHDLRDRADGAMDAAESALGTFGTSVQDAARNAASYASGTLSSGGNSVRQAGGNVAATIAESPVLLGALGLAAGALLGALLPQSDQEEAALVGVAGQARTAVNDLAAQGIEKGEHVVQAVTDSIHSSVRESGFSGGQSAGALVDAALSGELAGTIKQVAGDALDAGEDALRKEGLGQTPAGSPGG